MLRKSMVLLVLCVLLGLPGLLVADEPKTADEVIAKFIEAIGGRDKIDSVKSMRVSGKMVIMGTMEAPVTIEAKRPGKIRVEFTMQGMTAIQAYDGETGWFIMPFMGKTDPEKMPPEQVEEIANDSDLDGPLVDYKKKGHQVELVGKDEFEGTPTYKLKVTKENGRVEYYHLDAEHFLPLVVRAKRMFQGAEADFESTLGDYREIDGYMMAHATEQKIGGVAMSSMVFEKVELNVDLPDDRFTMPEVKEEEKQKPVETPSGPEKKKDDK